MSVSAAVSTRPTPLLLRRSSFRTFKPLPSSALCQRSPLQRRAFQPACKLSQRDVQSKSALSTVDAPTEEPPHHSDDLPETPLQSPARLLSDTLIGINVAVFLAQLLFPQVTLLGIKSNDLIEAGQYWRFLTPAFLHGSPTHLLVNMLSLHSLGPVVEWTCGRQRFLAIYLLAAITGNIASYVGDPLPSLGASGAVFGLSGALVVYFWRNNRLFGSRVNSLLVRLLGIIALNLGSGLVLPQIDQWGHLGGLLGGASIAFLLGPSYQLCLVKGQKGVWLIDEPPVEVLATPPRRVLK